MNINTILDTWKSTTKLLHAYHLESDDGTASRAKAS